MVKQLHPDLNPHYNSKKEDENRIKLTQLNIAFKEAYNYLKHLDQIYKQQQETAEIVIKQTMTKYYTIKGTNIRSSGVDFGGHFWMQNFRENFGDDFTAYNQPIKQRRRTRARKRRIEKKNKCLLAANDIDQ